jgi:hypothetical protein
MKVKIFAICIDDNSNKNNGKKDSESKLSLTEHNYVFLGL